MEKTRVFVTPEFITILHIFEYGERHRVLGIKMMNDNDKSLLLLSGRNISFTFEDEAVAYFNKRVQEYGG